MTTPNHAPDPALVNKLAAALDAQQARAAQLELALFTLTEPVARQVMFAVDQWASIASDLKDPRQPASLKLLRGWVATMDRAREVAGPLHVAHSAIPPPNGTT